MASKKIQLYTDRDKTIEASPETSANCVILSDGNDLQKVLDNDLTTPTVAHEETSFKVGVGDVNVSSSVVDGEVGRMVIKGKTYQNILPEPSTPVLTNNKEMFKVNEGLDPNAEVVDGISKSAILSGQTWVNGLSNPVRQGKVSYATLVSPTHVIFNHGDNPTEERVNVVYEWFGGKMGDGVDYTLDIWILKNTMRRKTDPNATIGKINFNSYNNGFYPIPSNTLGHITHEVTTSTTNTGGKPYIETFATCEGELEIQMVIRQGRNLEPIDRHFEGVASCKMPVLKTTGKNLFDPYSPFDTDYYGSEGWCLSCHYDHEKKLIITEGVSGQKNSQFPFLKFKPNTTYTFSGNVVGHQQRFCIHNESKQIEFNGTGHFSLTATTGDNGKLYVSILKVGTPNGVYGIENLQIKEGSTATSYEPHKSNILSTPQDLELRGIGNVKDTLDLMTGDVTERVGEVVLDGSENWIVNGYTNNQSDVLSYFSFKLSSLNCILNQRGDGLSSELNNIDCASSPNSEGWQIYNGQMRVNVLKSKLSEDSVNGFKQWLSQNPITVQYKLETPVIKTVDLSSSGNWEKVILDGSENWGVYQRNNSVNFTNTSSFQAEIPNANFSTDSLALFTNSHFKPYSFYSSDREGAFIKVNKIRLAINKNKLVTDNVEGFKQYMRQNPVTVWYQTDASLDSTQVKQPIFFKDGHVQLSSGTDNSLIPTLDYQAKTSNSYVMDLMKNGVWYTMKAKSASGTLGFASSTQPLSTNGKFAVDGASFQNANKLMVINGSVEDLMILEGDLTSKTIPYFKGIKSAFEGESKIEVLSTGKNLFDGELEMATIGTSAGEKRPSTSHVCSVNFIKVKPSSAVILTNNNGYIGVIHEYDKNYNYIKYTSSATEITKTTLTADTEYVLIRTTDASKATDLSTKFLLEVANSKTDYEPHKSNNTKIPLLSPLRSLPNGVCDELIIDRMKKKATLIQRVGVDIYNGSETWSCYNESSSKTVEGYCHTVQNLGGGAGNTNLLSNSFRANYRSIHNRDEEGVGSQQDATYSNVRICISRTKLFPLGYTVGQNQVAYFQKWLQSNPVTVLYPLLTPVVTEIDLESFPLVYKDGHIFLNSEIAPVVEIDYNINQSQQIQSNNETLQRHELDILDLDNLIVSFVNAEYNLRLLKFDMEMSMMALAE